MEFATIPSASDHRERFLAAGVKPEHYDLIFQFRKFQTPIEWEDARIVANLPEIAQLAFYVRNSELASKPKFLFHVAEEENENDDESYKDDEDGGDDDDDDEDDDSGDPNETEDERVLSLQEKREKREHDIAEAQLYLDKFTEQERAYYVNLYRLFYYCN